MRFQPDGRPPVTGVITRYNKKSVSILTDTGQRWNVAPHFLQRVQPRRHDDDPSGEPAKVIALPLPGKDSR